MTRITWDRIAVNYRHLSIPFVCTILLASGIGRCWAAEPATSSNEAALVQPFVSESTCMVIKVNTKKLNLPDLRDQLKSLSSPAQEAYQMWADRAAGSLHWLKKTAANQTVYATVGIPLSKTEWPIFAFTRKTPELSMDVLRERLNVTDPDQVCQRGEFLVVTPINELNVAQQLDLASPTPRSNVAAAMQSVEGYPFQLLLLPPEYVRRTVRDLMPELPDQLGGGPSEVLTSGVRWAALGIDPAKLRGELVIQSDSEAAAQQLAERLPNLVKNVSEAVKATRKVQTAIDALSKPQQESLQPLMLQLVKEVQPHVVGKQVTIQLDGLEIMSKNIQLLTQATQVVQQAVRRNSNVTHFKQILLAMHNYYDVHKSFPPAKRQRDAEGKSKLSWRVYLLPFVEQNELYQQFHLDEAWDSPHNKQLLDKMPDVYKSNAYGDQSRVTIKPGYTTFLRRSETTRRMVAPNQRSFLRSRMARVIPWCWSR